jgi:hypothetical protein
MSVVSVCMLSASSAWLLMLLLLLLLALWLLLRLLLSLPLTGMPAAALLGYGMLCSNTATTKPEEGIGDANLQKLPNDCSTGSTSIH